MMEECCIMFGDSRIIRNTLILSSHIQLLFFSAPDEFSVPTIERLPTALNVTWEIPLKPNGKILFYQVELDGKVKYNGIKTNVYIDGLKVFTKYKLKVSVCGEIACTSTTTDALTGELPPGPVIAPQVKVLGSDRVSVMWAEPVKPNGVITRLVEFITMLII